MRQSGGMKLEILSSFGDRLNDQVDYISKDKPGAARKFKSDILNRIKDIPDMPYANRKSRFFDNENIRDLVFKGYVIVYLIDDKKGIVTVFGFTKYQEEGPSLRGRKGRS